MRTCLLACERLDGHDLVKLGVLGDSQTLYPHIGETLIAARKLVELGFKGMVYSSDDPLAARRLEELGCGAVTPPGRTDRLRAGHPQPLQHPPDRGERTGSGDRRCRRLDEHRHRPRPRAAAHGAGDAQGGRGRREAYPAGHMPRRLSGAASSPLSGLFL